MSIKKELDKLHTADIFSLLLFVLYKFNDIEEYSTLSELAYVLDKKNLLSFCRYFGGLNIKVPTLDELEDVIDTLILYQLVNIEHNTIEDAINKLGVEQGKTYKLRNKLAKVQEVLADYEFKAR